MKDKYYTPSIEEFYIGFKCEFRIADLWTKIKWNPSVVIQGRILTDLIRVKYLNKEDIESININTVYGFNTCFKLITEDDNELVFATYWIEENEFLDEDFIYWNTKYNKFKITHKSKTLFSGKIKNISKLKDVLQMIDIING